MSQDVIYRWRDTSLHTTDTHSAPAASPAVADSWLVTDGSALAVALHRDRFLTGVRTILAGSPTADAVNKNARDFFDSVLDHVPRDGEWFPRVELHRTDRDGPLTEGGAEFVMRLRAAPELTRSVVVASIPEKDPRLHPTVKGPDLERMAVARARAAAVGAGEAIVLTDDGYVVEGAYSALLWWRGTILCGPPAEFDRIDSVTARSVLALAAALGVETYEEAVTPAELEGTELWSLSALHGIRIVTAWVDGPALAELPGRLSTWRARLGALRQPL